MIYIKLRWKCILKAVLLLFLLYEAVGGILPSVIHKKADMAAASSAGMDIYYSDTEGSERVLCIDDNMDALLWRLRIIAEAQEEIILSTFDMKDDNSGTDIMSALYDAAQRGVKVRILVDGMTGLVHLRNSDAYRELLSSSNVTAKFYNPVHILKPWKYTFRLHDKYLIVDDCVYISGGRNTYDLFLGDYSEQANEDRDLLVYETRAERTDTSMTELKTYFEKLWSSTDCTTFAPKKKQQSNEQSVLLMQHYAQVQELYPEAFEDIDYMAATMAANKVTYLSNGMHAGIRTPVLFAALKQLMCGKDQVLIQTPYIVCSRDMYAGLAEIAETSDSLEIITNAVESGANPWGCTDYLNQKKNILNTGAVVYEYQGEHSSHHKTILIDDRISIVGSYNLDMRSTYLDTEMMLVVDCPELNETLRATAEEEKNGSKCVAKGQADTFGKNYRQTEMRTGKKIYYNILRLVILPLRHML